MKNTTRIAALVLSTMMAAGSMATMAFAEGTAAPEGIHTYYGSITAVDGETVTIKLDEADAPKEKKQKKSGEFVYPRGMTDEQKALFQQWLAEQQAAEPAEEPAEPEEPKLETITFTVSDRTELLKNARKGTAAELADLTEGAAVRATLDGDTALSLTVSKKPSEKKSTETKAEEKENNDRRPSFHRYGFRGERMERRSAPSFRNNCGCCGTQFRAPSQNRNMNSMKAHAPQFRAPSQNRPNTEKAPAQAPKTPAKTPSKTPRNQKNAPAPAPAAPEAPSVSAE